jgi:hypothetical protein
VFKLGILFILCVLLFNNNINAQEFMGSDSLNTDSLNKDYLDYGADKLFNIYNYYFNLKYNLKYDYGNLMINQDYIGNTLTGAQKVSRDAEVFNLEFRNSIFDNIFLLVASNNSLLYNPGSIELNKMERISGLLGLGYNNNEGKFLELQSGIERNTQIGYQSTGLITRIKSGVNNFDMDSYIINFNAGGELLNLDLGRNNADFVLQTNISKIYGFKDNINLQVYYRIMDKYNLIKRDSAYLFSNNLNLDYSVERRNSNLIMTKLEFNFELINNLDGMISLDFFKNNVDKGFNRYVQNDMRTSVSQSRNLTKLNLETQVLYHFKRLNQTFGFSYNYESDENTISKINEITAIDFEKLKASSFDLDILSSIARFSSKSIYNLTRFDTLTLNISSSITRYDTPSPRNNSDKDELLSIFNLSFIKSVSDKLNFYLVSEIQLYHFINLKSQLSAYNYWMKTIRLSPGISIKTKTFIMRPQFSILANYVVYDFEGLTQGVKSYSLRQISYNDSIFVKLSRKIGFTSRLDLLYKETGILYWEKFEENPLNGNLKFFSRFYLSYFPDNILMISAGVRYFNLTQTNFSSKAINKIDYKNISIGPEATIKYWISENSEINFTGWYEFQNINDKLYNQIPNFFIRTSIKL